jgi:hypothetical protein
MPAGKQRLDCLKRVSGAAIHDFFNSAAGPPLFAALIDKWVISSSCYDLHTNSCRTVLRYFRTQYNVSLPTRSRKCHFFREACKMKGEYLLLVNRT